MQELECLSTVDASITKAPYQLAATVHQRRHGIATKRRRSLNSAASNAGPNCAFFCNT